MSESTSIIGLAITLVISLFVWFVSFLGYTYIRSEEGLYLTSTTRYTKSDRKYYGLRYIVPIFCVFLIPFLLIFHNDSEYQFRDITKIFFFYLFFIILFLSIFNFFFMEKIKEEKRIEGKDSWKIYFLFIFVLISLILPALGIYFFWREDFFELLRNPSWELVLFFSFWFLTLSRISFTYAEIDPIFLTNPLWVELAVDNEKIKNVRHLDHMIMQNMIKGGTIQGILAKETQENYILYMREIDSNIYINKSYVIAMADIDPQKQLKKDLEILMEGPMNEEELLNHCSPELKKDWVLRYLDYLKKQEKKKDWVLRYLDYLKKQEKIQKRDDKLKLTDKGRKWLKS